MTSKALSFSPAVKTVLIDILILTALYFIPALSHMFAVPLYMLEPMRLALIASILLTNKGNSVIIACTIPLFAYVVSSHPAFYKSLLIGVELLVNVFLFFALEKKLRNTFFAMAASIISAKVLYYVLKYIMLQAGLLSGSLISTPLYIQLILVLVLSAVTMFIFGRKSAK